MTEDLCWLRTKENNFLSFQKLRVCLAGSSCHVWEDAALWFMLSCAQPQTFWPAAAVQNDHTLHEFTMRCTRMFTQQHIRACTSRPEAHRVKFRIAGSGF